MFVRNHLMDWSVFEKIPVVTAVVTAFIENALRHNGDGCDLRLEGTDEGVFISVTDVPELRCEHVQFGLSARGSRRHDHRNRPTAPVTAQLKRRRERSGRARNARRTARPTGRGAPQRPTNREPIAPAGHGW